MQRRVCHNDDAMPSVPTPSKPTGYSPPLLNSAMKAYIAERYVSFDVAPRDLVVELKKKFGLSIRPSALRQHLTRTGLGIRRKQVDAKVSTLVSSASVSQIAKMKSSEPRAQLAKWVSSTVTIADKAIDMALASTRPRDLASSTSAASSAIKLFRMCAGLDGPDPKLAGTFNFNFSNIVPGFPGQPQPAPAVEVEIVPPVSEDEDDD